MPFVVVVGLPPTGGVVVFSLNIGYVSLDRINLSQMLTSIATAAIMCLCPPPPGPMAPAAPYDTDGDGDVVMADVDGDGDVIMRDA
jgi:hypothetical protein